MGTHPIFESDFDCLTEFTMLRTAFRHLRAPTKTIRRPLSIDLGAPAKGHMVDDALLVAFYLGCGYAAFIRGNSAKESFDYKGVNPKPKLFAIFQPANF